MSCPPPLPLTSKPYTSNPPARKVSRRWHLARAPKLVEVIAALPEEHRASLLPQLKAKPVRTASGETCTVGGGGRAYEGHALGGEGGICEGSCPLYVAGLACGHKCEDGSCHGPFPSPTHAAYVKHPAVPALRALLLSCSHPTYLHRTDRLWHITYIAIGCNTWSSAAWLLPILSMCTLMRAGIAVVAVMSKPHRCPHIATTGNICVYCPGGPDSDFEYSTQSYTG